MYYNGSSSNLPEDAHKLYDTFNGDDRDFFNTGRAKFFQASQNPQSVFGVSMICLFRLELSILKRIWTAIVERSESASK